MQWVGGTDWEDAGESVLGGYRTILYVDWNVNYTGTYVKTHQI